MRIFKSSRSGVVQMDARVWPLMDFPSARWCCTGMRPRSTSVDEQIRTMGFAPGYNASFWLDLT